MIDPARPSIIRQLGQVGIIIAITFAAYFPILKNGFIWDDDRYIEQNVQLHTLAGLGRIWLQPLKAEPQYYPLTHTSFWIEYHCGGCGRWDITLIICCYTSAALCSSGGCYSDLGFRERLLRRWFSPFIRFRWNRSHGRRSGRMFSAVRYICCRFGPISIRDGAGESGAMMTAAKLDSGGMH